MIDLRAGLGAPPIVFPGVRLQHTGAPDVRPDAPTITPGQVAQRELGCVGCLPTGVNSPVALSGLGVGDLSSWFDKIPLWAKIVGGVAMFSGVSYGVYRLVR